MDNLKNKRILALVGIVCLFLGTIMPYFKVSVLGFSYSISLWKYWEGKIILILIIANAMFIFKDYIKKYIPQMFNSGFGKMIDDANSKLSIIPVILIIAITLYLTFGIKVDSKYIKFGLGLYILWIGVIALVCHAIFYKGAKLKESSATQNLAQSQNTGMPMSAPNQMNIQNNDSQSQNNIENITSIEQQNIQNSNNLTQTNDVMNSTIDQPVHQETVVENQIVSNDLTSTQEQPIEQNNNTNIQSNTKICPQCGKEVDLNASICPICGYKFQ